jgi:hypothetical protein
MCLLAFLKIEIVVIWNQKTVLLWCVPGIQAGKEEYCASNSDSYSLAYMMQITVSYADPPLVFKLCGSWRLRLRNTENYVKSLQYMMQIKEWSGR